MKKSILITSGVVAILAFSGAGYFYFHKKTKNKTGQPQIVGFEALEDIRKAQGVALNTNLSSPTGKAWAAKDFAALKNLFGVSKSLKDNRSFFQASIYVLDVKKPSWNSSDVPHLHELQSAIVDYLVAKRDKPVVGGEAQVLSYASKVLLKFDSLSEQATAKMTDFYFSAHEDSLKNQKEVVGNVLVRVNPIPAKARKIILDKLHSKNEVYDGVLTVQGMRDPKAAAELWNEIAKNFSRYPKQYQAMIFKQMVINHGLIKADLKKHLNELVKIEDEGSQEAFLVGVRELDALREFRSDVQRVANTSPFPQSKNLAISLLNSTAGVK